MHAYTTPCYSTYSTLPKQVAAGGDLFNPSFERNHDAPWTCIGDVDTSIDDSFSDLTPAFEVLQEIRRMMDARKERERKRAYDRLVGAHRNTPFSTTGALPPQPLLPATATTTTTIHTVKSAVEVQRERQNAYDRLVGASPSPPPLPATTTTTTTVHTVHTASETQCERQKAYDRLVGIDRAPAVDFSRKSFMDLAQIWYRRGAPSA